MKTVITILFLGYLLCSCKKDYQVIMPNTGNWVLFNDMEALPLGPATKAAMEGVYSLTDGQDFFGDLVALKWSEVINQADTTFHISGFFGKDIAYFICEGKQLNGTILLNGYWRKMVNTQTGLIHLTINAADGAAELLGPNPAIAQAGIKIIGSFGAGSLSPEYPISFSFNRKLYSSPTGFQIMAHRSGGRTSDLLPASENSVAMILLTSSFGSTGIEIDVRFTKDGVPILYHDNTLNLREIQKCGLDGPIENYTYDQLSTFVRLIHGEKIPTLQEALDAVVYQTHLSYVWLDTKFVGSIAPVAAIQKAYIQKAAAQGRDLHILIGIPGDDQLNQFLDLTDYPNTPSLCELSIDDVVRTNAAVWAPRFTLGTQNDQVAIVHAQGRKVFVWTLDVPEFIQQFINEGHFDAILSNFPSCVAFYYYVQQ